MNVRELFEAELRKRGIPFGIDVESGRHALDVDGTRLLANLANLERDYATDGDVGRVARFIDTLLASAAADRSLSIERLYWCLEPNDYVEKATFRAAVSDCVDRVLVHVSPDGRFITWVNEGMLESLGICESDAGAAAFQNLAQALASAQIESQDIDGVQLGFIGTTLPFKASLILAPNLREVVGSVFGWPLLAVTPDRDFLYLWAARHSDFVQQVGGVVVHEHARAAYPISTEVYEISDSGVRAIGEFPKQA